MPDRHEKTSKFLSYVLRHRPDEIGLTLDPNGWASISELIDKARAANVSLSEELIQEIVQTFYSDQKEMPDHFNRAALAALLRTPQFTTWQEEQWLIHCNDVMVYLGEWKPQDFRKNAKDGDGRRLFLDMTDKELAHLWDEATPEGAKGSEDWYASYYAFRCSRCGTLRGNWDCP
jgi:uncharacterized protein CbrC (UPF0167 family)